MKHETGIWYNNDKCFSWFKAEDIEELVDIIMELDDPQLLVADDDLRRAVESRRSQAQDNSLDDGLGGLEEVERP